MGTEHAAVAGRGPKQLTTILAFIEELARIGGHALNLLEAAFWAGDFGFEDHWVKAGRNSPISSYER